MEKKIIIVGAGISGLAAGYYAQLNGFDTEIYEMHDIPGGLCTAWTRKGYTFDTSMHFLMSSKKGPMKQLWDELGITEEETFHYHDRAAFIEGEGKKLDVCINRQKLEEQMLAISPEDSDLIREYLDLYFGELPEDIMPLDAPEVLGLFRKIKMFAGLVAMAGQSRKYAKVSLQDFASRFKDPFLAKAVRYQVDSPGWAMPGFPLLFLTGMADSAVGDSGYPLGGSKKVVFGIARRFEELGGKIRYKTRVKDVVLENNKAVGVELEDGTIKKAYIVVWCADGHHLLFDILNEKYMSKKIKKMYQEWTPVKPLVHVMFGVDMDLSNEPHFIIHETKKPVTVGNKDFTWLHIMSHCHDKSTSPPGKSAIEVWFNTDYEYWKELSRDREKYNLEKKRIAEETADALDAKWPGFKSKIEMIDVPTPMTYERYTGNWMGSPDGWYITVDNFMDQSTRKTVPGLKNLYMIGQWTAPYTGTVLTSLSGRQLIQVLCKKNRVPFVSTVQAENVAPRVPSPHYT